MNKEVAVYIDRLRTEVAASNSATTSPAGRARLIFALDATASRSPTWDRACRIQGEMFEATAGLGGLATQLVYYAGYDTCQASRWVDSAADLRRLMNRVTCAGGETQIERVLSHAIKESETRRIHALVFVGDAMEEVGDRLCGLAGKLGGLKTPVFILHEGNNADAKAWFQQFCHLSRGACLTFEHASINQLKILLGGIAVYAAGGHVALASYGHRGELRQLTAQLTAPR